MHFTMPSSLALLSLSFSALTTAVAVSEEPKMHLIPKDLQLPADMMYDLFKRSLPKEFHGMSNEALKGLLPRDFANTPIPAEVLAEAIPEAMWKRDGMPKKTAPSDPYFGQALLELFTNMWNSDYNSAPIGKWFAGILPVQRFAKKVRMEPQFRKDARRYLALYGPIEIVAKNAKKPSTNNMFSLDPNGQAFIKAMNEGICKNCTIIAGRPGLLRVEDMAPLGPDSGVYIHHVITQDLTKPQVQPVTVCEQDGKEEDGVNQFVNRFRTMAGSGFIGQGDDNGGSPIMFTAPNKDFASGYYESGFLTGMNDKYVLYADLVNYNNYTVNAYMMFDIEYLDGHQGGEAISTLISVTGCDLLREPVVDTNGPASTMSKNFPILQDSKIISAKGHMHDGGTEMVLYINDEKVCTSSAVYSSGGTVQESTIVDVTYCPEVISVKKGDVMKMESVYDLKKHPLRATTGDDAVHGTMGGKDLMGMMAIVWVIDPELTKNRSW